jgi:hypothetical protein
VAPDDHECVEVLTTRSTRRLRPTGSGFPAHFVRSARVSPGARPRVHNETLPRLSAKRMYLAKWLPFVVVGGIVAWQWTEEAQKPSPDFVVLAVVTLIVICVVIRQQLRHAWRLADEVLDGGEYLIVKRGKNVVRVELSQISDAAASSMLNATTVFLHLSVQCEFGAMIEFLADSGGNRWKPSPIASELVSRVEKRNGRAV